MLRLQGCLLCTASFSGVLYGEQVIMRKMVRIVIGLLLLSFDAMQVADGDFCFGGCACGVRFGWLVYGECSLLFFSPSSLSSLARDSCLLSSPVQVYHLPVPVLIIGMSFHPLQVLEA